MPLLMASTCVGVNGMAFLDRGCGLWCWGRERETGACLHLFNVLHRIMHVKLLPYSVVPLLLGLVVWVRASVGNGVRFH